MSYGFSMWSLGSGLEKGIPLDAHLTSLWRLIEDIKEQIITIPVEMKLTLQCVAHFAGQKEAFAISAGHFATAAYYRLDWDFDFYFDDNFGCEVDGQPYWKW